MLEGLEMICDPAGIIFNIDIQQVVEYLDFFVDLEQRA